ncbi:hypothetical protein HUJ04_006511 [Dendroctonus ponderosae]|nr:hypothetical protein HUJ04_006511 [Dendroctonus ponderosae]
MSKISTGAPQYKGIGDHQKYLFRITKTLYYGKLPKTDRLSLPLTELAAELFSSVQKGKTIDRLHLDTATQISRNACVSPCSLVLAMLYFERLKRCNVDYLERTSPSDLFLVSLVLIEWFQMVSSKYLFDDGESDEVFMDEWAASSEMTYKELGKLERDFLAAINWELFASSPAFWKKLNDIEAQLALKQGTSRGCFTYTELETLGNILSKDFHDVVQTFVIVTVVLAATYTAALLMMFGSVVLAGSIRVTNLYPETNVLPIANHSVIEDIHLSSSVVNDSKKSFNYDIVKVFKASILLASIKTEPTRNYSKGLTAAGMENCQNVGWDWWNTPVMNWLAQTSQLVKTLEIPVISSGMFYFESTWTNEKFAYLEDHIRRATKTRLQDQLERSWHVEWIDTIQQRLAYNYFTCIHMY